MTEGQKSAIKWHETAILHKLAIAVVKNYATAIHHGHYLATLNPGVMKMNIDDVDTHIDGSSTCGGILCNLNDKFISGFYAKLHLVAIYFLKFELFSNGVSLVHNKGISNVIFEIDSLTLLFMINKVYIQFTILFILFK
uniref:Uncharacterized protein LOC113785168 n=1 Tax=Cicer arietinum TaxID=3827 RepID=A0A3Q7XTR1_CICAR|nr:uncharacterized protein LOC113785168 [Cicer arietinum]XP_027187287.1 uncharacterized protein LOC113785168 [Cicer arietinum]XP_027187288.1 uncharacterized protein LOC113785168 [Cicer arietinum]